MAVSASIPSRRGGLLLMVPGWIVAGLMLAGAVLAAPVAGGLIRPGFVLGCIVVSAYAWQQSTGSHLQAMLMLFCFAPFARRVVDYFAGFDAGGLMLVGPLMALLVPVPRLLAFIDGRRSLLADGMAPILVVTGCVGYAALVSVLQGDFKEAASGTLKWLTPLLYAAVLIESGERRKLVDAATNIFMLILPVMGLYGVVQYINPAEWDRNWMRYAVAITAGLPLPYEIRVYSTLNGPASFATFTAAGILLVSMLRPFWLAAIVCSPAALALLLSQYRTAWVSLALGLIFCLLFWRTRGRTLLLFVAMVFGAMGALAVPKFSDALIERFETFGQGSNDGSLQERFEQYGTLWSQPDSSLIGVGFSVNADAGVAGAMPVDGMLIACWLMMGIIVGAICLSAFVWAAGRAITSAFASGKKDAVVLGGLALGAIFQMPLASLASGELGFLFWTIAALAAMPDTPRSET